MNFTFQEKGHRYELDGKPMTGVTTILGVLAKPALIPWAANMTAEWIRENCKRGEMDYLCTEEDLQEAVKAHTKKKEAGGDKGKDLHSLVEQYIKECIEEYEGKALVRRKDVPDPMFDAFVAWAVKNDIKFLASEQQVYHSELFYAGTFDFSFEKEGKRYIGDLKTMKKMWDRTPFFQTAGYIMAAEHMGEKPYDGSCIVNINKETSELTDQWTYDNDGDRGAFAACLTLYRQLSNF